MSRASDRMTGTRRPAPIVPRADDGIPAAPRPEASSVGAIVVTYHPDPELRDRLTALEDQVAAVLIVDNGSTETELASIAPIIRRGVVEVTRNGRNLGLAAALNQGLAWAAERGFSWALTLDQDTTPGPAVVSEAARVFDAFPNLRPAVIGASWDRGDCADDPGRPATYVITAGALHSIAAWAAIGRFREDFFIDYVDVEFCLRARSSGYAVLSACVPTISHAIGHPKRHRTPLRSFTPSHHDRFRRYYITRNRVHVWRAYWRREPRHVAFDMTAAGKELVKLLLFEDDRRRKLAALARGARDGIRGVTGPLALAHLVTVPAGSARAPLRRS